MQPTAYVVTQAIRMRYCYYCHAPIATAFYLPSLHGWACAACYTEHVIVPAVQTNCAPALPEHVDAGLESGATPQSTEQGPRLQSTRLQATSAAQVAITQLTPVGVPSPVSAVA